MNHLNYGKIRLDLTKIENLRFHRELGSHIAFEIDGMTLYASFSSLFKEFAIRTKPGGNVLQCVPHKNFPGIKWVKNMNESYLEIP